MSDLKSNFRQEFDKHRDEIRQLAEEVRVKVNLAGKEAREAWQKLEPQIQGFEKKVEQATAELAAELKSSGQTLREQLHKLRERLR